MDITFHGNRAYVGDLGGNSVSVCDAHSDGSLLNCVRTAQTTHNVHNLAIDPHGRYAYVRDTGGFKYCAIDATTGLLSNCIYTGYGSNAGHNSWLGVALSADGESIYGGWGSWDASYNYTFGFKVCPLQSDGSLGNCTDTGSQPVRSSPVPDLIRGNKMYAAQSNDAASNAVTMCTIDSTTGLLSDCQMTGPALSGSAGIVFNDGYAYISPGNYRNYLNICTVQSNGSLTHCQRFNHPALRQLFGVAIHTPQ